MTGAHVAVVAAVSGELVAHGHAQYTVPYLNRLHRTACSFPPLCPQAGSVVGSPRHRRLAGRAAGGGDGGGGAATLGASPLSLAAPAREIDGDTVVVSGIYVRLKGVDAAERAPISKRPRGRR